MAFSLSPGAQLVLDQLTEPGSEDDVIAVPLPHGLRARERRHELKTFQAVVDELRAAGWAIEVERRGADNGEVLTIALAPAPRPDAA